MSIGNITYGMITGRLIRAVVDGDDEGRDPDLLGVENAKITFKASIDMCKNVLADPPAIVFLETIACTTAKDGQLIGPDDIPGIKLVATDNPAMTPTGWTWTVTVSGPTIATRSWSFSLPGGSIIDLAAAVPVPPDPGSELIAWEQAIKRTEAAAASAQAYADLAEAAVLPYLSYQFCRDKVGDVDYLSLVVAEREE